MKKLPDYKYNVGDFVTGTKSTYKILKRYRDYDSSGRLRKYYVCECQNCHGEVIQKEHGITNCVYCANKKVLTGFNDIATTNPELIKYFKNPDNAKKIYANSSSIYVETKCPLCGHERKIHPVALTKIGKLFCPQCGDNNSYPNRLGLSVLQQLPIENLETEYSPDWALKYRYDFSFYYKNNHYLLEMDGGFHFEERFKSLDELKKIDDEKDNLAKKNSCILIRIECKKSNLDYIKKNIYNSLLNSLFDLSIIDWIKCEHDCSSNLTKEIADYYNITKDVNKTADNFYMCRQTIVTYLKRGTKLGWCNYQTHFDKQYANILKAAEIRKKNPDLNYSEIGQILGVSCTTVSNYLKKAKDLELIDNIDNGYQILKNKIIELLKNNPDASINSLSLQYGYSHETLSKYKKELNESIQN